MKRTTKYISQDMAGELHVGNAPTHIGFSYTVIRTSLKDTAEMVWDTSKTYTTTPQGQAKIVRLA